MVVVVPRHKLLHPLASVPFFIRHKIFTTSPPFTAIKTLCCVFLIACAVSSCCTGWGITTAQKRLQCYTTNVKTAGPVLIFLIVCALLFIVSAEFLGSTVDTAELAPTQTPNFQPPQQLFTPTTGAREPATCKSFVWQEDAQEYADKYGVGGMDGDNDGVACEDLLSKTKYQNYNGVYKGNTCTGDCSGHEAGYNWASDHGIGDTSDCGGNSNSFIEGCISYVEENY